MSLHVLAVATDTTRARWNKQTADHFGYDFQYIVPTYIITAWKRIETYIDYLNKLNDDDIVLCMDTYDVLLNQPPDVLLERFYASKCDVLLSGELNCFPPEMLPEWNGVEKRGIQLYPNGGVFMGTRRGLLYMLTQWKPLVEVGALMNTSYILDQGFFHLFYIANRNTSRVKIDDGSVFQSMHQVSWYDFMIRRGQIYNIVLDKTPCLVHFNGGVWEKDDGTDIQAVIVERMLKGSEIEMLTDQKQKQVSSWRCMSQK
jgi:hypothetical protein